MKRLFVIATILVTTASLLVIGIFWWKQNTKPVSVDKAYDNFVIPRGYSASQIGNKLETQGFIKSSLAFKIYSQISSKSKKIQAGEYRLSPGLGLYEITDLLTKGPLEVWVTVPEGLRREEVVERFINGLGKKGEEAVVFRKEFMEESLGQEGYLFPDTYLFPKTANAPAVVSVVRRTFDKRMKNLGEGTTPSELSLDEIVILASIIERETKTNKERPLVSGILLNRLDINMGLQVDAAVQYVVGTQNCKVGEDCNWWPVLKKEDLRINSSFNTYKYRGFPPSPIANPGLSSLRAAAYPEETDYFYYLHDSEGQIHCAKTLDEHNSNVREYLGK